LPVRRGDQRIFVPRKGLPAFARPLEIDRVADTERHDPIERQLLLAKNRLDVACLLAGDRNDHVDIERRPCERRLYLSAELLLEPSKVVGGRHRFVLVQEFRWTESSVVVAVRFSDMFVIGDGRREEGCEDVTVEQAVSFRVDMCP